MSKYERRDEFWAQRAGMIAANLGLHHVNVNDIVFIEDVDTEDKPERPLEERRYFTLRKIPDYLEDVCRASYVMVVYRLNLNRPNEQFAAAALADELLKVPEGGGGLVKPEIRTHKALAHVLGSAQWRLQSPEFFAGLDLTQPLPGSSVQQTLEMDEDDEDDDDLADSADETTFTVEYNDKQVTATQQEWDQALQPNRSLHLVRP